jgi:hypothetical protein
VISASTALERPDTDRRKGHRVNILIWHVHGSWTTAFVQGLHRTGVVDHRRADAAHVPIATSAAADACTEDTGPP